MNRKSLVGMAASLLMLAGTATARAQIATSFTYQGQLKNAGVAVESATDVQFSLWTAASGGSQVGPTVTKSAVSVSGGLFTTDVDFGVSPYTSSQNLYVQISVRNPAGSGSFTSIGARQALTAAPFSLATRGVSVAPNGAVGIAGGTFDSTWSMVLNSLPGQTSQNLLFNPGNGFAWGLGAFTADGAYGDFTLTRTGTDYPLVVRGASSNILLNASGAGNVGIGTATPARKLHTVGGAVFEGSPGAGQECVQIWGNDGTTARRNTFFGDGVNGSTFTVGFPQNNTAAIGGNTNHDLWLGGFGGGGSSFTPVIAIKSLSNGGNVGIGTTSPLSKLSVVGGTNTNTAVLIDSGATTAQYSSVAFADRGNRTWSLGMRPDGMFGIDRDGLNTWLQINQQGQFGMGGAVPAVGRAINVQGGAFCTGSVWTNACDKNLKEDFKEVNPEDMLSKLVALPITTWRYKGNDKLHLGPTAQDFRAAFGLGENDTSIGTVDADGVSLAAIKGLNARLERKDAVIHDLQSRLEKLEALVAAQANVSK